MTKNELESLLKNKGPKPKALKGFHLVIEQLAYEKGWEAGITAYKKMLRSLVPEE